MYEEELGHIEDLIERLNAMRACLNVEGTKREIAVIQTQMTAPGFWNDPEAAQKTMQKLKALQLAAAGPEELLRELDDAHMLIKLSQEEGDESMAKEVAAMADTLAEKFRKLELKSLFTDPRDEKTVILSIHPGAGGTESCDWAEMLYRMVLRWCERNEYHVEEIDYQPGEEAGLKSATLKVSGPYAYGYLKSESGVHRLVRISPYDSARRRHTSFAAIEVLTEVDQDIQVDIREDDLKMDVFRASGHGGQKVNKTSSAVRLTHLPTGIVVSCQMERSQHRNRSVAMEFLRAKLYDIEMKKKEQEVAVQREGQQDVAWGSQIRSYVLHPYQLIKDHRTGAETGRVDAVLDGDLDMFIEAYLKWNLERKTAKAL